MHFQFVFVKKMSAEYSVVLTIDTPKSNNITIHVVPSHWIVDDVLFYPINIAKQKIEALIQAGKMVPVNKQWKKYACVIKGMFKTYDAANKFLDNKENSEDTDSEADANTPKKLQREQSACRFFVILFSFFARPIFIFFIYFIYQ